MNNAMQESYNDSAENIVKELRATFREEAFELLAELESSLLELEKKPGDKEQIGRAFRAMHTIKGSGEHARSMRLWQSRMISKRSSIRSEAEK